MRKVTTYKRSFTAGELSPACWERHDIKEYTAGSKTCLNFIPLPQGAIMRRAGMQLCVPAKFKDKTTILVDFSFSTTQALVLEFGDHYIRFISFGSYVIQAAVTITGIAGSVIYAPAHGLTSGESAYIAGTGIAAIDGRTFKADVKTGDSFSLVDGNGAAVSFADPGAPAGTCARVYEIATPYAHTDLPLLNWNQSSDVVTLCHPSYPPYELKRYGATNWTISQLDTYGAYALGPSSSTATATTGTGTKTYGYGVTSVTDLGESAMVVSLDAAPASFSTYAEVADPVTGEQRIAFLFPGAPPVTRWDIFVVQSATGIRASEINGKTFRVMRLSGNTAYCKFADDTPIRNDPSWSGIGGTINFSVLSNDLTVAGNKNTITWTQAESATSYNIYKRDSHGNVFGYIGNTTGLSFIDDNIIPDTSKTPPQFVNPFNQAGRYPRAVCYYEQRRIFSGTNINPHGVWFSVTGSGSNFSSSVPLQATDAIAYNISARKQSTVHNLVGMNDIIAFTDSSEWRIGTTNGDALSAATLQSKPQAENGASTARPCIIGDAIIFVRSDGREVMAMQYSWEKQLYSAVPLMRLSDHLVGKDLAGNDVTIKQVAFCRSPVPLLYALRTDGVLLSCTYMPDQNVIGWAQHMHGSPGGSIDSICAIQEGGQDALYCVVTDRSGLKSIQRMVTPASHEMGLYPKIDGWMRYVGAPTTTIHGLHEYNGRSVSVFADGSDEGFKTVVDGAITLDVACSDVTVGFFMTSLLRTLPLAYPSDDEGTGHSKSIIDITLKVIDSKGIVQLDEATGVMVPLDQKRPTGDPSGAIPSITGAIIAPLRTGWDEGGSITISCCSAYNTYISSIVTNVAISE